MKVVEFPKRELMDAETKALALEELQNLITDIEDGKVDAVFAVWTLGDDGTGMLRCGAQGFELTGGVEWLKQRMILGME